MISGLHLEPTSRCTLACSRCARTVMIEKFGKNSLPIVDLDPAELSKFFDVKIDDVSMCGVHGDPIYHANFNKLLEVTKEKSNKVQISTNGSYRTKQWWNNVCQTLEPEDSVVFGIDGTPENFSKYRINGDWNSILVGINECVKSSAKIIWQYIPFSYNENNIAEAERLANELGFDEFVVKPSDRWEDNDWLRPTNQKLTGNRDKIQNEFKLNNNKDHQIDPKCKNNREHYISAAGYYSPCCRISDPRFYYKSQWWKNKEIHNIKNSTLSMQLELFEDFYEKINVDRPDYCVYSCGKC